MTNWRDTIMTHTEMRDRIDELQSLLAIARENEERTAAANRELVSRLSTAAIEAEALERWRVRAERAESRLDIAVEALRGYTELYDGGAASEALKKISAVERHDSNG